MIDILQKAIQEISDHHRKIIDDWCKAYIAQLYEAGVEIKPEYFTLNQMPINELNIFGYKYWFESGTPKFKDGWIKCSDRTPSNLEWVG